MQKSKIKMQNGKVKFKKEFKQRVYNFILRLIEFIDNLPKDSCSRIVGEQRDNFKFLIVILIFAF